MEMSMKAGDRVVLTCKSNLSWAGSYLGECRSLNGHQCLAIELDRASGFTILCPLEFVLELRHVPISGDRRRA